MLGDRRLPFAVEFDQPWIKPQLRRAEANQFLEELEGPLLREATQKPHEGDLVGKAKPVMRAPPPAELHEILLGQGRGPLELVVGKHCRCDTANAEVGKDASFAYKITPICLVPRAGATLPRFPRTEKQPKPGHFALPQRARRKWVRHGENDELVNAIRMSRSREPRHGGSPVLANDVRCVDTEPVKNADHIADRVLQRIRAHSFGAIGASEATQVRRNCAPAAYEILPSIFLFLTSASGDVSKGSGSIADGNSPGKYNRK